MPHIEVRCLLERDTHFDLSVNGVALIRGTTVYGLGLVTMQFRPYGLVG